MRRLYRLLMLGRMAEVVLRSDDAWLRDGGGGGTFRDPNYRPPAGRWLRIDGSFPLTASQTRLVREVMEP